MQTILGEQSFPSESPGPPVTSRGQVQSVARDAHKALFVRLSESLGPASWEFPSARIQLIFILLV